MTPRRQQRASRKVRSGRHFWFGVTGAIIAAGAAIWLGQKNFDATLAAAKTDLDNAAKNASDSGGMQVPCRITRLGEELVTKIETEFDESAVQRNVKKELVADLRAFKVLADRLKVPPFTELSDYAGQLLGAYARGEKHWDDYEKQERQNIQKRGEKALQALDVWAKNR